MNNLLNKQIKKWISKNLKLVSVHNPVSIHIDALLNRDVKKSEMIDISIQAFTILVKQIQELQMPVKPLMTIPLIAISKRIERSVPDNLITIENQLDIEPSSLYLLDWAPAEYFETCEEFRSPLSFKLIDNLLEGIYVYYREFRYEVGIENDWEFSRGIYVGYYSYNLRLTQPAK